MNSNDHITAHKHCIRNRSEIERSNSCGCFYCFAIFLPQEISKWIDDSQEQTAECPKCDIDSVIGDASGYPITREFLEKMHAHFF